MRELLKAEGPADQSEAFGENTQQPWAGDENSNTLPEGHQSLRAAVDLSRLLRQGSQACFCRSCGVAFRSVRAFDVHRYGPAADRRCYTTPRMPERGLVLDARGFWSLPKRAYTGGAS